MKMNIKILKKTCPNPRLKKIALHIRRCSQTSNHYRPNVYVVPPLVVPSIWLRCLSRHFHALTSPQEGQDGARKKEREERKWVGRSGKGREWLGERILRGKLRGMGPLTIEDPIPLHW